MRVELESVSDRNDDENSSDLVIVFFLNNIFLANDLLLELFWVKVFCKETGKSIYGIMCYDINFIILV